MSLGKVGLLGEKGEAKRLQVDSASLADLKAELFRKKGEAHKNKEKGNFRPEKTGEKKNNIWSKENTGIIARMHKDMEAKLVEDKANERVKSVLERKARLYDSLKKGKGRSEIAKGMLVDFDRRRGSDSDSDNDANTDYPANDEDDEWVEYTDMLGRTRTCMKKDLSKLKQQDKDLKCDDDDKEQRDQEKEEKKRNQEELDMLSEDMRRELLRQKWEKEEMENLKKDTLHYGDVVFDEARTLGAGYYAFSRDEDKRKQEQDTLKKLHEETDDARKVREKKAEKRKKDMAERIKKIKRKRREKLGLPPEESEDEEEPEKNIPDDEEDDQSDISKSVLEGLKMFRRDNEEEERRKNELQRRANTRDWDVGKEEMDEWKVERKVMDQKEWIEKQRKERNKDFAPPTATAYSEARYFIMNNEAKNLDAPKAKKFAKKLPQPVSKDDISNYKSNYVHQQSARLNMAFPPPSTGFPPPNIGFPPPNIGVPPPNIPPPPGCIPQQPPPPLPVPQQPPPQLLVPQHPPLPGRKSKFDLDPMANLDVNPEPETMGPQPKPQLEPNAKPMYSQLEPNPKPMYSQQIRIELHNRMKNQEFIAGPTSGLNRNIINELEAFQESESDEEDDDNRGKGSEVAPPCDMEYYTSSSTWNPDRNKGARSHFDMAEAFSAGIKAQKKKDETDSE